MGRHREPKPSLILTYPLSGLMLCCFMYIPQSLIFQFLEENIVPDTILIYIASGLTGFTFFVSTLAFVLAVLNKDVKWIMICTILGALLQIAPIVLLYFVEPVKEENTPSSTTTTTTGSPNIEVTAEKKEDLGLLLGILPSSIVLMANNAMIFLIFLTLMFVAIFKLFNPEKEHQTANMLSIIGSPNPVVAPAPPPMVQQARPVQTPPAQSPRQPAALLSPVQSPAHSPALSPAPSPGRSPVGSAETAEEKQKKTVKNNDDGYIVLEMLSNAHNKKQNVQNAPAVEKTVDRGKDEETRKPSVSRRKRKKSDSSEKEHETRHRSKENTKSKYRRS